MTVNKANFFAKARASGLFGPTLSQDEVDGLNAVLDAVAGWKKSWIAYALATTYHETAKTMKPIKEYGGPSYFFRMYDPNGERPKLAKDNGNIYPGDGAKFYGRGYVQITWRSNYGKFGKLLGIPLTTDPDLALLPVHAAKIMRIGMEKGLFTGRSLARQLPNEVGTLAEFKEARRIINGLDKSDEIATLAVKFQGML